MTPTPAFELEGTNVTLPFLIEQLRLIAKLMEAQLADHPEARVDLSMSAKAYTREP